MLEFFCLTPLPGSEDHQVLWKNGVAMDPDLNKYDVEHVCTAHPRMSKEEWEEIYHEAWSLYYTPAHMKTLLRRAAATGVPIGQSGKVLLTFSTTVRLENVHPLQGGILRLKHPSERRPGLPRENAWIFWPRFVWETLSKARDPGRHDRQAAGLGRRPSHAIPRRAHYMDQALTPVGDDEDETLDLLTKTTGARAAVAHVKKVAELTGVSRVA